MPDKYIIVYLQDILDAINDIESCFQEVPRRYDIFENSIALRCVVERKTEIMGEALNRIRKIDPAFNIPNLRAIIDTRNRIIHAYDSVQPEFLWGLVIRHIPALKIDIQKILTEYAEH
ncbi:MAG: DUF86 domain-containing protein [Muribaculaceae bacterium]